MGMRDEKRFMFLIFLLLLFVASLLFYLWGNAVHQRSTIKSLQTQSNRDRIELNNMLRRASMEDRTVILTTINKAYAGPGSILDLFLESFHIGERTKGLLNHLLILAMDQEAFDRCKAIHPHCYPLTTTGVDFSAEKQFITRDYFKLKWKRIEILRTILELGYSFIFTDADVMWLRNPFLHFSPSGKFHIAYDYHIDNPTEIRNDINGGFNYVRSDAVSIEFFRYWHMSKVLYPGYSDQSVLQIIRNDMVNAQMIGLGFKYLDTSYFGGFCEPSEDMNKVCTMRADCCEGIERKFHDLKLVLEDWRNFTKLSTEEKRLWASSSSTSPWRAPSLCKS
ncbi:uncharacterized protein At4g15970-like [Macadamia integrifolia]|uniref:uncharacterized protein At4g15970-like n=1 Tax=Macadamia integrifolia TaxID=60698 RepID=UPI001C4E7A56|nr:uncharacterized protein At4g15970-like [Macadamia integrifolia]XP_042498479.1 uncharacterized protein At4g15970-like [Macadamia integrifolia]